MHTYAIRFDDPDGQPVYAGLAGQPPAWGFAPSLATAHLFDDADVARRTLENGYTPSVRAWGKVVRVGDSGGVVSWPT
jgi:hypothetical protein